MSPEAIITPEPLTCTVASAALALDLSVYEVTKLLDKGDIKSGYTRTGRRLVRINSLREFVDNLPSTRRADDGDAA